MLYNPTCPTMIVQHRNYRTKLQNISEVSILSIRQIQEFLSVDSQKNTTFPVRIGTNLGDLDLNLFSVFVDHHVYIIKRIVPWLCIAPFVLTCQQYSDGKQQDHARQM